MAIFVSYDDAEFPSYAATFLVDFDWNRLDGVWATAELLQLPLWMKKALNYNTCYKEELCGCVWIYARTYLPHDFSMAQLEEVKHFLEVRNLVELCVIGTLPSEVITRFRQVFATADDMTIYFAN